MTIAVSQKKRPSRVLEYAGHVPKLIENSAQTVAALLQTFGGVVGAISAKNKKQKMRSVGKNLAESGKHFSNTINSSILASTGLVREAVSAMTGGINFSLEKLFRRKAQNRTRKGKLYNNISNRILNLTIGAIHTGAHVGLGTLGTVQIISQHINNKISGKPNKSGKRFLYAIGDATGLKGTRQTVKHITSGKSIYPHIQYAHNQGRARLSGE